MPIPKPLKNQSGFSLLEVMVALSIISIVLVSGYRMHSQTLEMHQQLRFQTTAPLLAQNKLAETETMPPDELSADAGVFEGAYSGYSWQIETEAMESDFLGMAANDLKHINITIRYHDILAYRLETYRFRP